MFELSLGEGVLDMAPFIQTPQARRWVGLLPAAVCWELSEGLSHGVALNRTHRAQQHRVHLVQQYEGHILA